ncbi:hypothetical protein [Mycobacteroides abscessus]|uniref:hypothetical protein n=1 Tax=Mycobacteroides abscessus TaxID=36809 RepID=UPI00094089D8|nr:hypothetical protein [Mycobacteroides abscessus]
MTIALASALVSAISALRSREAKRIAEEKRDEAVTAAQTTAEALSRLAKAQESRQAVQKSVQASCVVFDLAEIQRGFSGWWVRNDSDQPVTNVVVRGVDGTQIVVYRGSGPEPLPEYPVHTLGARQRSELAFRPTGSSAVHADHSEVERMALRFTDARGQGWERIGAQAPQPVE